MLAIYFKKTGPTDQGQKSGEFSKSILEKKRILITDLTPVHWLMLSANNSALAKLIMAFSGKQIIEMIATVRNSEKIKALYHLGVVVINWARQNPRECSVPFSYRETMKKLALLLVLLPTIVIAQTPYSRDEQAKPANRTQAVEVVRQLRRIVTPKGVDRTETMRIGGIDQVVDVRGRDRRNPILLLLHGGPGFPESALAWWDTRDLEEYFTIVQWDQRGSGRTYLANDPAKVAPTMKPAQFVSDAEELVMRLRQDYGKSKIFLLGHSWGSYIGLEVARRHPDWLYAYIGVGQAANTPESERRGYAFALAAAERQGNFEAIAQLKALSPYVESGKLIPLEKIVVQRRWLDHFGGAMAYRDGQSDGMAVRLSPDYTDDQAQHAYDGNGYSQNFLFSAVLGLDLSTIDKLACPLILLEGRHDKTVNSEVAREWFQRVQAPSKQFFWFEHSGHEVMTEEPGKVLMTLVQHARPLASSAGDIAPEGE